jgi:hypothetical protein
VSVTTRPFYRIFAFLFQNVNIGELFPEKNQQFEIFYFTKVMAKKVKNVRSFFEKVAMM